MSTAAQDLEARILAEAGVQLPQPDPRQPPPVPAFPSEAGGAMPTNTPLRGIDLVGRRVITMYGDAPLDDFQMSMVVGVAIEAVRAMFNARMVTMSQSLGVETHESIAAKVRDMMANTPKLSTNPPDDDDVEPLPDEPDDVEREEE